MTREEWAERTPALKRSIDQVYNSAARVTKPKVWHDNEGFLKNPNKGGLVTGSRKVSLFIEIPFKK